jgi:hypothetical protein
VAHSFNPSTQEVEAGGFWVQGQSELHSETLSQKTNRLWVQFSVQKKKKKSCAHLSKYLSHHILLLSLYLTQTIWYTEPGLICGTHSTEPLFSVDGLGHETRRVLPTLIIKPISFWLKSDRCGSCAWLWVPMSQPERATQVNFWKGQFTYRPKSSKPAMVLRGKQIGLFWQVQKTPHQKASMMVAPGLGCLPWGPEAHSSHLLRTSGSSIAAAQLHSLLAPLFPMRCLWNLWSMLIST